MPNVRLVFKPNDALLSNVLELEASQGVLYRSVKVGVIGRRAGASHSYKSYVETLNIRIDESSLATAICCFDPTRAGLHAI